MSVVESEMSAQVPLYNSRLTKTYIHYLSKNYPDINIDSILQKADIAPYEVEDSAHWFTQEQADRFHDVLVAETGDAAMRWCCSARWPKKKTCKWNDQTRMSA